MKAIRNQNHYYVEVPRTQKSAVADLMAYRGLTFSMSASSGDKAILFSDNPYALADLPCDDVMMTKLRSDIEASYALSGSGKYPVPPGKELWPFQVASLDYVTPRGGGLIADAPGLGKTPQSIAFCNHFNAQRVLVIVPASLRIQWGERIKEWSTLPNLKVSVMLKPQDGIHPRANYQVISYNAATNPAIIRAISRYQWDVLIIDEVHNCKNIEAIRTRAILGNGKGMFKHGEEEMPAIARYCKRKILLTGTPLLNRPSEVFTLARFLDHEAIDFMGWEGFKDRYNQQAQMKTHNGKRFKLESTSLEKELQNRLRANIMTRHEKHDVMKQLKPPRYGLVRVEENGAVKGALDVEGLLGMEIEDIQTVKDIEVLGHIAEARRLMGEAIAPQAADYTKTFLEGSDEKIVLFGWHISVLNILEKELSKYGLVRVDGRKNAVQRQKAVDDFINDPKIRVFLGNIQTAGTGVDGLQTVCSTCYIVEPDWVPAQNEQAVSRLDRIGQKDIVHADIFVAPGSISEKILVRSIEKLNTIYKTLDERL